ncbi:MAG: peptidylprolyl isomerase [Nitrospirae bacterium]|nr:peptidylprolyl isomerase [Nitrospirota bacterium]
MKRQRVSGVAAGIFIISMGLGMGTAWAQGGNPVVTIETDKGKIIFEMFPDAAPKTVARIAELIKQGFYNGLTFHRVVPGFVIQGGDPKGNGTGGSGVKLPAEFNKKPHLLGTVAMARANDPDSADSQFYICLAPQSFLDGKYTVFGQVTDKDSLDVIQKIRVGDAMKTVTVK